MPWKSIRIRPDTATYPQHKPNPPHFSFSPTAPNSPQHETTIDFHNFYFYEPFVVSLLTEYIPVVRDDGQEVIESAAVRKVHDANSNDIISVVLDAVPEERQTDRQTDRKKERKR